MVKPQSKIGDFQRDAAFPIYDPACEAPGGSSVCLTGDGHHVIP